MGAQAMQKLLAGKTLDPVNAIIIDMEAIPCVDDALANLKFDNFFKFFFKFANPLYAKLKELLKSTETIDENYDKLNKEKPTDIIDKWTGALDLLIKKMESIQWAK